VALGSWKQNCIIWSTTFFEYIVVHVVTNEINWMCILLGALGHAQVAPTKLWNDNEYVIQLVQNLKFHCHNKHINIKYHIIKEKYKGGKVTTTYISTKNQLAYIMTKILPHGCFQGLQSLIGMSETIDVSMSGSFGSTH
jgi:hypothetical protein